MQFYCLYSLKKSNFFLLIIPLFISTFLIQFNFLQHIYKTDYKHYKQNNETFT